MAEKTQGGGHAGRPGALRNHGERVTSSYSRRPQTPRDLSYKGYAFIKDFIQVDKDQTRVSVPPKEHTGENPYVFGRPNT